MKKYIILFSLFLSSCFGIGESTDSERGLREISGNIYILKVPENWNEVTQTNLPLPKSGDMLLALVSPEKKQGYLNNLVLIASDSTETSNSSALVKKNIGFVKQNMLNFSLISERDIQFQDETKGSIIIFSGRYNTQTPNVNYLQTARNCSGQDIFLTLSLAETPQSYEAYEYILKSLSCR